MKNEKNLAKSFTLDVAAVAVFVAIGVQLVLQLILSLFPIPKKALTWTVVILNQVIFFAAAFAFCRIKKVDILAVTGAKQPPKWYYFPLFILIAVCCVTCFGPLAGIFSRFLSKLGYDHKANYFIPFQNGGLFTLAFLALTLLPVLGEEVLLRGVLLSGAKKRTPVFAVLYTALIFALMHGNLNQIVHQFLLGVVMGYLAYLTGGIYAAAAVHVTNNAFALLLDYGFVHSFVDKTFYWYMAGELNVGKSMIGMGVSLFALIMLLVLVTCLYHRDRSKTKEYQPVVGSVLEGITAYMIFLSTPTAEAEEQAKAEQKAKGRLSGQELFITVFLPAMLALIVLLTLIPGGK